MPIVNISDESTLISAIAQALNNAGISYWTDRATYGSPQGYFFVIEHNIADLKPIAYIRVSGLSINCGCCDSIVFSDVYDNQGNYLGRKVTITGNLSLSDRSISSGNYIVNSSTNGVAVVAGSSYRLLVTIKPRLDYGYIIALGINNLKLPNLSTTSAGIASYSYFDSNQRIGVTFKPYLIVGGIAVANLYPDLISLSASFSNVVTLDSTQYAHIGAYNVAVKADGSEGTNIGNVKLGETLEPDATTTPPIMTALSAEENLNSIFYGIINPLPPVMEGILPEFGAVLKSMKVEMTVSTQ